MIVKEHIGPVVFGGHGPVGTRKGGEKMVFHLVCEKHKVDLRPAEADVAELNSMPALAQDKKDRLWVWNLSPQFWFCPTDYSIIEASSKEVLSEADWNAYVEDVGENKYGDSDICRDYWTVLDECYAHAFSNCSESRKVTQEELDFSTTATCPYFEENTNAFARIFGK
jgi:hypothetical protein